MLEEGTGKRGTSLPSSTTGESSMGASTDCRMLNVTLISLSHFNQIWQQHVCPGLDASSKDIFNSLNTSSVKITRILYLMTDINTREFSHAAFIPVLAIHYRLTFNMFACYEWLMQSSVITGIASMAELAEAIVHDGPELAFPDLTELWFHAESNATKLYFLSRPREQGWHKQHLVQFAFITYRQTTGET